MDLASGRTPKPAGFRPNFRLFYYDNHHFPADVQVRKNYRSILQNHIFTNTEQKYMMLLPFERERISVLLVTMTSKLPTERALNRHKTVTSREFQDTPTTLGR
jgi:hypothetical protein